MRVFITGGTGLIGTTLALHYRARGDEVVVLSKEATEAERDNAQALEQAGVERVRGSVTDRALVERCCRHTDLVHHVAAMMREANVPDRAFWEVNVEATLQLLEIAQACGVRRVVYCSSIGVMGKSTKKPADESSPCRPQDIYQVTKRAAEERCLEFSARHGLPLSVVRPADVYGPRDRRLLKLFRALKKRRFVMIGDGENEHHMVYVDDLVRGMMLAGEKEEALGEVFILAGAEPVRVRQLVEMIAEDLGVAPPKWSVPLGLVWGVAAAVEAVCRPLGLQPPIYPRRVDFFRTDYAFSIERARTLLGYEPEVGLREGIHRTRVWYEEAGLL